MYKAVEGIPDQFETIAVKLRDKVLSDLSILEASMGDTDEVNEQRLKSLTGFFKLLQSIEEMIKRIQQERDKKTDRGVDILEFRQQLEKQIAKLVDDKIEETVS